MFLEGGDAMSVFKCSEFEITAFMYLVEPFTLTYSLIPKIRNFAQNFQ